MLLIARSTENSFDPALWAVAATLGGASDAGWSSASSLGCNGSVASSFDGNFTPRTFWVLSSLLASLSSSGNFEIGSSVKCDYIRCADVATRSAGAERSTIPMGGRWKARSNCESHRWPMEKAKRVFSRTSGAGSAGKRSRLMQLTNPASTPRVKNRKHPAMDRSEMFSDRSHLASVPRCALANNRH